MPQTDLDAWLARAGPAEVLIALSTLMPGIAVVVVDGEGRVLLWGGEAERLLGWPRERVIGRPCPQGVVCDPAGDAPRPFGATVKIRRADGTRLVARHYVRQFTGPDGGPLGAVHLLVPAEDARSEEVLTAPTDAVEFHGILSRDPAMIHVLQTIRNAAETEATILVRGESGTGKELVARAIHAESHRRDGPFVAVNCAAFSPALLESELFGHKRGAFTGATTDRQGIFAQADGGTLFLDEVAELSADLQAKLLRVLQDRTFVPVGGTKSVQVDVRVIAATHRALRQEVQAGRFRADLMYRLRVVPIFLPPLRDRPLDVEFLLRHAIASNNAVGPRHVLRIAPDARQALLAHPWPGNVRELQNVIEHAFAVGRGPELTLAELPPEFREAASSARPSRAPGRDEAAEIRAAIEQAGGNLGRAAEILGISRVTLWRRRQKHGIRGGA